MAQRYGANPMSDFPWGFAIEHDGQRYWPLRVREHVNRKGEETSIIEWGTTCPTCGEEFSIITSMTFREPRRRCDACKAPGRPVRFDRKAITDA